MKRDSGSTEKGGGDFQPDAGGTGSAFGVAGVRPPAAVVMDLAFGIVAAKRRRCALRQRRCAAATSDAGMNAPTASWLSAGIAAALFASFVSAQDARIRGINGSWEPRCSSRSSRPRCCR